MPSVSLAVSDIISFVHGGSQTTSTVQSLTPWTKEMMSETAKLTLGMF